MVESVCQNCGQVFATKFPEAKFCGRRCYHTGRVGKPRPHAWHKPSGRPRSRAREERSCKQCGGPFTVPETSARKFCRDECYQAYRPGKVKGPYLPPFERICAVCGKPFVKPRTGGYRKQRVCSVECQRVSRYRRGAIAATLSPEDAAYLAGIIDGEGSIILGKSRLAINLHVSVTNTSRALLEWVEKTTAVGAICDQRAETAVSRRTYFWRCNADAALSLLRQLLPRLVVKRAQAELAISFQERLRDPALKADRSWQLELMTSMRSMNRRGPKPRA